MTSPSASAGVPSSAPAAAPVDVLLIAGAGRSGSTLLDRIMGWGPDAVSTGEVGRLWRTFEIGAPCGCGRDILTCEFWRAVLERVYGHIDVTELHRHGALSVRVSTSYSVRSRRPFRTTAFERDLRELQDLLSRTYAAIAAVAGAHTVIDSTKYFSHGAIVTTLAGVRPSTLQLVRDGRAVAYSWRRPTAGALGLRMRQIPVTRSAIAWGQDNVQAELLGRTTGAYRRIRYEDLAARPAAVVQALGAFYGLRVPPISDAGTVELGPNHNFRGNPNRFEVGTIAIRPDEEWRTLMTDADARKVTLLTWPLLLRYGYRLSYRP